MSDSIALDRLAQITHYLRRGWAVVPLHDVSAGVCSCGNPDPEHTRRQGGKHPIYANWQIATLRTPGAVAAIWDHRPFANVGIATGAPSGFWVLDFDPDNASAEAAALDQRVRAEVHTQSHRTGSGGRHWLFAMPADFEPTNRRGSLPAGLDIRGTGGQIVVPPSQSGKGEYVVECADAIAPAPAWLLDMIRPPAYEPRANGNGNGANGHSAHDGDERGRAYARAAVDALCAELAQAAEGTRNETAFRVACRLHELANARWARLSVGDALVSYLGAAQAAHESGLSGFPEPEALAVWVKAERKVAGAGAVLPPSVFGGDVLTPGVVPPFLVGGISPADSRVVAVAAAPQGSLADPAADMLAEMLDSAGLDLVPPLEPLIVDVLARDTLARIYGPSGHGKSFVALDMAAAIGGGRDWHGRATTQGTVVYLVAEGARGIRKRVRAWERHHGAEMVGVRFLPRPVQAIGPEWAVLTEACRRLGAAMVVVDTQARATVGIEENSAKETGQVVHQMELLRAATGACVLLVHHAGNDGERARGSSAWRAAMQTELSVNKAGRAITMKTGKQKDDDDSIGELVFDARTVELGTDASGRIVDSLVLTSDPLRDPEDDSADVLAATGYLASVARIHFASGNGGTRADIRKMVGLPDEMWHRAWGRCIEEKILCKVRGAGSWRYVSIEARATVVEPDGDGAGFMVPD